MKIYHWNTLSYSRHKASDEFIGKFDALTDSFVEVYIGRYGRSEAFNKTMKLDLPSLDETQVVEYLEEARTWMQDRLPKMLKDSDTDLFNLRDEMLADINQTLYLFTLK